MIVRSTWGSVCWLELFSWIDRVDAQTEADEEVEDGDTEDDTDEF